MMRFLKNMVHKAKKTFRKMKSKFDKGGSYTGTPDDPDTTRPSEAAEMPEQDADDL